MFDQYELDDSQQSKKQTQSLPLSALLKYRPMKDHMDLDEIPLWSNNTNFSNTSPKDASKGQTIIPEVQPLWDNQAKTTLEPLPEEKIDSKISGRKTPQKRKKKSLIQDNDGVVLMHSEHKEENVETTSDELSKDSWLVENNLQIDQDNFFAELTEETPSEFLSSQKSLPQNTDGIQKDKILIY